MAEKLDLVEILECSIRGKLGRIEYLMCDGKGHDDFERNYPTAAAACYARDALRQIQDLLEDFQEIALAVFVAHSFLKEGLDDLKSQRELSYEERQGVYLRQLALVKRLGVAESLCDAIRYRFGRDSDAKLCGLGQRDGDE